MEVGQVNNIILEHLNGFSPIGCSETQGVGLHGDGAEESDVAIA